MALKLIFGAILGNLGLEYLIFLQFPSVIMCKIWWGVNFWPQIDHKYGLRPKNLHFWAFLGIFGQIWAIIPSFWAEAPIGDKFLVEWGEIPSVFLFVHLSVCPFVCPYSPEAWAKPREAQARPREALARPWEAKSGLWGGPIQAKGGQSQGLEGLSQAQGSLSQALGGLN